MNNKTIAIIDRITQAPVVIANSLTTMSKIVGVVPSVLYQRLGGHAWDCAYLVGYIDRIEYNKDVDQIPLYDAVDKLGNDDYYLYDPMSWRTLKPLLPSPMTLKGEIDDDSIITKETQEKAEYDLPKVEEEVIPDWDEYEDKVTEYEEVVAEELSHQWKVDENAITEDICKEWEKLEQCPELTVSENNLAVLIKERLILQDKLKDIDFAIHNIELQWRKVGAMAGWLK